MLANQKELCDFILDKLDDLKAQDPVHINVSETSTITDDIIIVTGTSSTHIKQLASYVLREMKKIGYHGEEEGAGISDWIVVDFGTVIIHILQEEARKLYSLEKLFNFSRKLSLDD